MCVVHTAHGQWYGYVCRYNTHTKDKSIGILRENTIKMRAGKMARQIKELDAKTDG